MRVNYMTATALPFPQAPPQVWPRHTGREKERSFEGSGTRGGILSRRDLLKLIGAAGVLAFLGLMTGCSPAAETETSPGIDLNFTESMETGNFAMPIRPWAMQDGSPEVVSGDNLKFIIKNRT